jgi:hypothetical protein
VFRVHLAVADGRDEACLVVGMSGCWKMEVLGEEANKSRLYTHIVWTDFAMCNSIVVMHIVWTDFAMCNSIEVMINHRRDLQNVVDIKAIETTAP